MGNPCTQPQVSSTTAWCNLGIHYTLELLFHRENYETAAGFYRLLSCLREASQTQVSQP